MDEVEDKWTLAEATDEDGLLTIFRIRNLEPILRQSDRLNIVWEYEPEGDERMPSEHVLSQMNQCEELMTQFELDTGNCSLVGVVTGDGFRTWILYSSDVESFGDFVNHAFSQEPPFPIEIEYESDSEWTEYRELLELLDS